MDVTTIGNNALLFANLPPANQVRAGRVYRVSNVGPAPGIRLETNGTRWSPLGGSQMLASIRNAPVVQSLTNQIIATFGPFPGGLVRAGMGLLTDSYWAMNGIGAGARNVAILIGNTPQDNIIVSTALQVLATNASGMDIGGRSSSQFSSVNDVGGPHTVGLPFTTVFGITSSTSMYSMLVNLSQPWYITAVGKSTAETAVAITGATWSAGVITFPAPAHTLAVGDKTTVAGFTPSGYNGVYVVASVPDANTFTVAQAVDPGAYVSGGTSSRISNVILRELTVKLES